MGEKINQFLAKPVYVYLYGLAFIIFKISAYPASFSLLPTLNCLFLYCIEAYTLILVCKKIMNPAFAGLAAVIINISFLHVVGIAQLLGFSYAYIPIRFYGCFYAFVILLIFSLSFIFRKFSSSKITLIHPFINVFLLISIFIFVTNGFRRFETTRSEETLHMHNQGNFQTNSYQKDIIWILMDEYGSSESLKKQFAFQNPLDTLLENKHFNILHNIHSRFNNTLFSVNSIFNEDDSIPPSSYYEGIDLLRHGSLIPALEKSGYRFVNLGFFDLAQHAMIADRSGYPYTFLQQLFSGTIVGMIYMKWKNTNYKADAYNHQIYQLLDDTISVKSTQPRFIWAHMTIPHEPFCRDADGNLRKDTAAEATDSLFLKRGYLSYLQYGNRLLISLLNKHPEMGDKIIVISGDHGPRFPFLQKKEKQKQPFAAIHFPGMYDSTGLQKLEYISQIPGFLLKHIGRPD